MNEFTKKFPIVVDLPVIWGEMDAFQHVNNTVYFRYFETARIAYFDKIDFPHVMKSTGVGPILASTSCRFRLPLKYPDSISCGAKISKISEDRVTMSYQIISSHHQKIAAEGEGLLVAFDYKKNQKSQFPRIICENIKKLEDNE